MSNKKSMSQPESIATSGNGQEPEISNRETLALELIHDLNRSARIRAAICNLILDPEKLGLEALERVLCFLYGGELTDSDVRKELTNLIYDPAITEEELTRIRDFAWEVRIESGEE